ncbi:hypothetical protein LNP25_24790 [Klebsiella variicola subsp. variicola]|nr:hypothetical protein [Klebsiella variicola subsp. variicola]
MSYLRAHPQESWGVCRAHPELKNRTQPPGVAANRAASSATDPAALDKPRYEAYEQFLYNNKLVKKSHL